MTVACTKRLTELALYAGGDLSEDKIEALEVHLAQCADCRRELEALRASRRFAASSFAPEVPSAKVFLEGVARVRARDARRRAVRCSIAAAVAAVVLVAVVLVASIRQTPKPVDLHAAVPAVEVERVGYSEAIVSILPTPSKSMTVVWIVSDEVVAEEN